MFVHYLGATISTRPRKGAGLPPSCFDTDTEPDSNRDKNDSKLKNIIFPGAGSDKVSHTGFSGFRRWISNNFPALTKQVIKKDGDNSDDKEALAFEVSDRDSNNHF